MLGGMLASAGPSPQAQPLWPSPDSSVTSPELMHVDCGGSVAAGASIEGILGIQSRPYHWRTCPEQDGSCSTCSNTPGEGAPSPCCATAHLQQVERAAHVSAAQLDQRLQATGRHLDAAGGGRVGSRGRESVKGWGFVAWAGKLHT